MLTVRQKRFKLAAEAILTAQEKVEKGARLATVVRFQMDAVVTYRVYVGKSSSPFKDCRVGEGFRPFGWVYQYAPNDFMKASENHFSDVNSKSERFKIKPDGSLEEEECKKHHD